MNNQFGYTFKGLVDMRIIMITIVKIHIVYLTYFILQTAVESMMHNKLPIELVV